VRRRRREGGQSLVELAIVTPLLLLLFMGTVDAGRIIFAYIALEDAVQEGTIFRSHNPTAALATGCSTAPGCVRDRVQQSSNHDEVRGATVTMTACSATTVSVTATYSLPIITPLASQIFGTGFPMAATFTGTNLKGTCT
jgi:Flp pilus assembly protein TadG